jgi:hypothetical protein
MSVTAASSAVAASALTEPATTAEATRHQRGSLTSVLFMAMIVAVEGAWALFLGYLLWRLVT